MNACLVPAISFAFSVFIINDGKMLIQMRNPDKYHSGGLWSNACCSHQRDGEGLTESVHRRMAEELGFDCHLEEKFSFIYRTQFRPDLIEYEFDHVFVICMNDGQFPSERSRMDEGRDGEDSESAVSS